ncbi:MAG: S8 family serine peptidase [Solirubrobacterales bacterium]
MRKTFATAALTFAVALVTAPAAPAVVAPSGADYVPGELLVRFAGERERLIDLPPTVAVGEAARALQANPEVAYAVPDYIARTSAVPNDFGLVGGPGGWQRTQWNFLPCGSVCGQSTTPLPFEARGGINAPGAWEVLKTRRAPGAKGVKVAVLDTGVAYLTEKPRFRRSPDFAKKQFLPGFDFVDKSKMPLDRDGHGTHVAGTIAERTGNRFALTGLAYRAKIIPVRVLDAEGFGRARDIGRGVRFAAKHGAKVINMSFEFSGSVNSCAKIPTICSAIRFAAKRGAVVVSAAGNENGQPVAFPAGAPHVIGVGRVTKDACLANGSRTGSGLDLVAPGGGLPLLSTCGANDFYFSRAAQITQFTFRGGNFRAFGYPGGYEGTSMAAAHVSGVAAMVLASRVVGRSPAAVECQLEGTARNKPGQLGQPYDPLLFGAGLVDAAAAVTAAAPGC